MRACSSLIALVLGLASYLQAQTLNATATVTMSGYCAADNVCYPDPGVAPDWGILQEDSYLATSFLPGGLGFDQAAFRYEEAMENTTPVNLCDPRYLYAQAKCYGRAIVDGIGTSNLLIAWGVGGICEGDPEMFSTRATDSLDLTVVLDITGGPSGFPVIVYYSWDNFGGIGGSHETQPPFTDYEDSCRTSASLSLTGAGELFAGRFDFWSPPDGVWGFSRLKNQSGSLNAQIGDQLVVTVSLRAVADANHQWPFVDLDRNTAHQWGQIRFSVGTPVTPNPPDSLDNAWLEFSLDIGSDAELSDPVPTGNEAFDPGDMYVWNSPLLPPGGLDGLLDDAVLFPADPYPDAPDFGMPPLTRAPVGSGLPPVTVRNVYFDLDGDDNLDFDLSQLVYGPGNPAIAPFPSACIHSGEYLLISFDDDSPDHYTSAGNPSVPVNSQSPWTNVTYGKSATKNEVIGLNVFPYPPAVPYFLYPYLAEGDLHPSLVPDPDPAEALDDDADALDICDATCSTWYFSADHEATYGLDPCVIYEAVPGGYSPVITQLHLGLLDGTDVDAFEFAWIWDDSEGRMGLALLFSVDDDDPLTVEDESGGEDPRMIYASFLNGTHFPYLAWPLTDDVDAITAWETPLFTGYIAPPGCPPADSLTIWTDPANNVTTLRFYAPVAGIYEIRSATDPNAQYPADFVTEVTITALAGWNSWDDGSVIQPFKQYVVVQVCP